jgi:oligogalacturonide lyase
MHWTMPGSIVAAATLRAAIPATSQTGGQPPRTWIDADTGHPIVRLTNEPASASLYFHQNGYTR